MNTPAFPCNQETFHFASGLTKRELFAAMAPFPEVDLTVHSVGEAAALLQISVKEYEKDADYNYFRLMARRRVQWADALIAELEKPR